MEIQHPSIQHNSANPGSHSLCSGASPLLGFNPLDRKKQKTKNGKAEAGIVLKQYPQSGSPFRVPALVDGLRRQYKKIACTAFGSRCEDGPEGDWFSCCFFFFSAVFSVGVCGWEIKSSCLNTVLCGWLHTDGLMARSNKQSSDTGFRSLFCAVKDEMRAPLSLFALQ